MDLPSYMTVMSEDDDDMEEERRLCYVGITRAKKKLYLSAAKRRMMQGRTQFNKFHGLSMRFRNSYYS